MIILFDVAEECHTSHGPVFGSRVTLEICSKVLVWTSLS